MAPPAEAPGWSSSLSEAHDHESDEDRKKLEKILHPEILSRMRKELANIVADYAVVEVPLLIESELQLELDRVLVVDCPLDTLLRRLLHKASTRKIKWIQFGHDFFWT